MRLPRYFLLVAALAVGCQEKQEKTPPAGGTTSLISMQTKDGPEPLTAVKGTIGGKEFVPDTITFEGDKLTFRKGKDFFADMQIEFSLRDVKGSLEGKEWEFTGDKFENPTINVAFREKEGEGVPKTDFVWPKNYSMKLKITKHTPKTLEGTIDLSISKPAETKLAGKFAAVIKKTAKDPLGTEDAPYIQGKIVMPGEWKDQNLAAGFVSKGTDGKIHSNMAGTNFSSDGGGWVTSSTFAPQLTSVVFVENKGPMFKHSRLEPGEYWIYVKRNGVLAAYRSLKIKEGDEIQAELKIEPAKTGTLTVTFPKVDEKEAFIQRVKLFPEGVEIPGGNTHYLFDAAEVKKGDTQATIKDIPAGKYKVVRGESEGNIEIVAGKETSVTLAPVR